MDNGFLLKQWIGCGRDSDHQPVYLQILSGNPKAHCPFKFNARWLENDDLVSLLKASWVVYEASSEVSLAYEFAVNLKRLKEVSISWSVKKKA